MTTSTENRGTATVKDVSSQPVETATALPNSPQTVNVSSENQGDVSSARKCAGSPEQCVTPRNQTGNPSTTEQCSVSVAKELPKLPKAGDVIEVLVQPMASKLPGCWITHTVSSTEVFYRSMEGVGWRWPIVEGLPFCAWLGCRSRVCEPEGGGGSVAQKVYCYPHAGEMARKSPAAMQMLRETLGAKRVAEARPCSVPGCNCVLGADVKGDLCAPHRRQAERKCARKGCSREHLPGSIWCSGHRAAAVSCDNLPAICESDLLSEDEMAAAVAGTPDAGEPDEMVKFAPTGGVCEPRREEGCTCCHVGRPCSCCAVHRPWSAKTKCKKCGEYLPCNCASKPSVPEEHEQPNDGYQTNYFAAISKVLVPRSRLTVINDLRRSVAREVARGFVAEYEQAWQLASDDEHNEPVTVAQCKLMSDAELTRLLNLLSEVLR